MACGDQTYRVDEEETVVDENGRELDVKDRRSVNGRVESLESIESSQIVRFFQSLGVPRIELKRNEEERKRIKILTVTEFSKSKFLGSSHRRQDRL